jgi:hypothetical protein
MASRKPLWKRLRIGDRVRFVRLPTFEGVPGGGLHRDTRRLYKMLIARGRPSRIFQIDEYRLPWIYCRFRRKNGTWEIHWLAINDDSWILIKPRRRSRPRTTRPPEGRRPAKK